jgi:uncharacterized protein (DUF779 family)
MIAENPHHPRVSATPAARQAIHRLRAARGGPLMFVQSGGCCAGSTPMCFPAGEFITGPNDVLLGELDGCPFYIDAALDNAWNTPEFVLDVADGEPEGFSLGAGEGRRFVVRSDRCAVPQDDEPLHRSDQ